ncbi:MAG: CapA family protein [Acidimicrobiales bacterium]
MRFTGGGWLPASPPPCWRWGLHRRVPVGRADPGLGPRPTLSFNAPPEIAVALRHAGFDACDTASNHTWDRGLDGVKETDEVLDATGIGHAGGSRSQQKADSPPTRVVLAGHRIVAATDRFPRSYARTVANMGLLGPDACDARPAF